MIDLNETNDGPVTVIALRGRLDGATASAVNERLTSTLDTSNRRLLLELSQLEYISSAGFRVLLLAAKRAHQTNAKIVLAGIAGHVRDLFEIGGFLKLFKVCDTRDEGLSALR